MGSFMQHRNFGGPHGSGGMGNFHVFGSSMSENLPILDMSEFPSLTNTRGQNEHALPPSTPMQPPGSKPYGKFSMFSVYSTNIYGLCDRRNFISNGLFNRRVYF